SNHLLAPKVIGYNHVIGESRRGLFDAFEHRDIQAVFPRAELVSKQLWNEVMDVQDELRAPALRTPRSKDQEVGNVVHVDKVVADLPVAPGQQEGRGNEKTEQAPSIHPLAPLVRFAALDPVDGDSTDTRFAHLSSAAAQSYDVHMIAPAGK